MWMMCLGVASMLPCFTPASLVTTFLFSACFSVPWQEWSGILGKAVLCVELFSRTDMPLAPVHEMPVVIAAHRSLTCFLPAPAAPLLILSCTMAASLTDMIGSDSWLIEKVVSCKGIIKTDTCITFYFNLKQLKVHPSLIFFFFLIYKARVFSLIYIQMMFLPFFLWHS